VCINFKINIQFKREKGFFEYKPERDKNYSVFYRRKTERQDQSWIDKSWITIGSEHKLKYKFQCHTSLRMLFSVTSLFRFYMYVARVLKVSTLTLLHYDLF
jgi:hypothetical protein